MCIRDRVTMRTHNYTHRYKLIDTRTHDTDKSRAMHQHAQNRLPWHFWILLLVLLAGKLPNSCNGLRAHPISAWHEPCLTLDLNVDIHATILPFYRPQLYNCTIPTPPQRSHRNPIPSSAARSTRVSNCPRKAIAPTAHMGRSGSGTSLV